MKIVFHIDDQRRWSQLFGNLHHMIEAKKELVSDLSVALVATGNAVQPIVAQSATEEFKKEVAQLAKEGIAFNACHQSLLKFSIQPEEILNEFQVVPYGVIALAEYQDKGYRYIKP